MASHRIQTRRLIVALAVTLGVAVGAPGLGWLLQEANDPVGLVLAGASVAAGLAFALLVFVLVIHLVSRPSSRTVSWVSEYERLRGIFTAMLMGAGFTRPEALAVLDEGFEPDEYSPRVIVPVAFTQETRRSLRAAAVVLSQGFPVYVALNRFHEPDGHHLRDLHLAFWRVARAAMKKRNPGRMQAVIYTVVPPSMEETAATAMRDYLNANNYPHLLARPMARGRSTEVVGGHAVSSPYAWSFENADDGSRMVTVVYVEAAAEAEIDAKLAYLSLVAAASPLARTPLSTGPVDLQVARAELGHWAELLSLRRYAPAEFVNAPSFRGMVEPNDLARWAMEEVILAPQAQAVLT